MMPLKSNQFYFFCPSFILVHVLRRGPQLFKENPKKKSKHTDINHNCLPANDIKTG